MRVGCTGCLGLLVMAVLGVLLVAGAVGGAIRMLAESEISAATPTAADGTRAQRKLFDLASPPRRPETVNLSEAELNALLANHLVEARGVRLASPRASLVGSDRVVLHARIPLRQLLDELSLGVLADFLPGSWQRRPMGVQVGAHLRMDASRTPRHVRMEVEHFAIGRQRLPVPLMRLLLDPASLGMLQWPLPSHVERVTIEPSRVVVQTTPTR